MLTPQVIVPTLLVPLIGYRLYRRFRANFGRQPVQQTRMVVRLLILALVIGIFMMAAMRSPPALQAAAGGLAAGILLGVLGVRLTRFESDAQGRYYTPNSYIGGAVTLLWSRAWPTACSRCTHRPNSRRRRARTHWPR